MIRVLLNLDFSHATMFQSHPMNPHRLRSLIPPVTRLRQDPPRVVESPHRKLRPSQNMVSPLLYHPNAGRSDVEQLFPMMKRSFQKPRARMTRLFLRMRPMFLYPPDDRSGHAKPTLKPTANQMMTKLSLSRTRRGAEQRVRQYPNPYSWNQIPTLMWTRLP